MDGLNSFLSWCLYYAYIINFQTVLWMSAQKRVNTASLTTVLWMVWLASENLPLGRVPAILTGKSSSLCLNCFYKQFGWHWCLVFLLESLESWQHETEDACVTICQQKSWTLSLYWAFQVDISHVLLGDSPGRGLLRTCSWLPSGSAPCAFYFCWFCFVSFSHNNEL